MLMLAVVAEEPNEPVLDHTTFEICAEFLLDERGDAGVWIIRILKARDERIEVGLDERIQQPVTRAAGLISTDRFGTPARALAKTVPVDRGSPLRAETSRRVRKPDDFSENPDVGEAQGAKPFCAAMRLFP